ncbi:MAG TPA: hypothetical protein VF173_28560 [Thermoanaerobaculia bacterium]|nr:hypothetical protein [Thermoanaerobaculia bacterium]
MATRAPAAIEKVHDPELTDWLSREDGEVREILVDAALPRRTVSFEERGGRLRPTAIPEAPAANGRKEALRQLRLFLEKLLGTPPVLLEAAGALAVRATSRQVRGFVDHPLVKSVRPNRLHRTPA